MDGSQPGLTGGSDDSYVRHLLIRARSKGWRVVVFNSRGCGDSPVTTPQVFISMLQNYFFADMTRTTFELKIVCLCLLKTR